MRRTGLGTGISAVVILALVAPSLALADTAHKVRKGDTLWALSARYHTSVSKICRANGIRENAVLSLGKSIRIPTKSHQVPARRATRPHVRPAARACYFLHTTTNSACLRSGPSTRHKRVALLRAGTTLKHVAIRGAWRKVALSNGVRGFVYGKLVAPGQGTIGMASAARNASAQPRMSSANDELVRTAMMYRGSRYSRGGTSRGGFDCSGFTRYVFAKYGIRLPHSSAAQSRIGRPVSRGSLQPGDLVFFNRTYRRGVSHVGIYVGDGKFVHASTHGRGVRVDSLNQPYYTPRYCGARRMR